MKVYVELHKGVYLADWDGDPGRTLCKESAKIFRNEYVAKEAILKARKYRAYKDAKIVTERLYMGGD